MSTGEVRSNTVGDILLPWQRGHWLSNHITHCCAKRSFASLVRGTSSNSSKKLQKRFWSTSQPS